MRLRPLLIGTGFGLLLLTPRAHAQAGFGSPLDADTPVDAAYRRAVVESLIVQVQARYVFADKGAALARSLKKRLQAREYDDITSGRALAESLTAHMQAVTSDGHMRVHYRETPFPAQLDEEAPAEEVERQREEMRFRNYGFEQVRRLPGNVGYLDLRMFSGAPEAHATAVAAMQFLASCDAIIVDLRRNGGGSPEMIQTLLTYLVPEGERLHINDFYRRAGDRTEQFHTASHVPGRRLAGKPLYVLTSPWTASAAEEFAYDVQTHKLGTVLGGTSAGAAHPGGLFRLAPHHAAFIATGRAVNPITRTNWEGVGVKPDIDAPPHEAVRRAHVLAIEKLQQDAKDEARRKLLDRSKEAARSMPVDKPEEFQPPPKAS